MCMMESTYAIANSIAGVSGVVQADADEIITVPGTNIQSDETEQFDQILKRQKPQCRNLYEEFQIRFPESEILYAYGYPIAGNDESHFEEALQAAKQADIVILTLGGKHGTCSMASMGEGIDSTDINLPKCQDAFIRKAAQLGKPLVGVHFDGRPISSDAAEEYLDAILEAWSPSETGAEAVVDILTGIYNPGGKASGYRCLWSGTASGLLQSSIWFLLGSERQYRFCQLCEYAAQTEILFWYTDCRIQHLHIRIYISRWEMKRQQIRFRSPALLRTREAVKEMRSSSFIYEMNMPA